MLRRALRMHCRVPTGLCTSRPIYEVLNSKLASSQFDPSNPRVATMTALLHRNHVHTLGCWKDMSAAERTKFVADNGAAGAEAASILSDALASTPSNVRVPKVLIAYGSQTGTAEALARMAGIFAMSTAGVAPTVVTLNDATALLRSGAHKFSALLVVTSTYGQGELPTNAMQFWTALSNGELSSVLSGIPHAVFGLGNSNNQDNFNAAAKNIAAKLQEIGSPSLAAPVLSCELAAEGHDAKFRSWKTAVWSAFEHRGIGNRDASGQICDTYNVTTLLGVPAESFKRFDWIRAHVTYNELQSARNFDPAYRHLIAEVPIRDQIQILGRKLIATDQLVFHPHNKKDAVNRALAIFGFTGEEIIEITPLPGAASSFFDAHKITTRTLFREIIDLSAVPARSTLAMLCSAATDAAERAQIDALANDLTASSEYARLTAGGKVFTVLDVLERFRSIKLTLSQMVSRLPHIKSRYYSNAHDPRSCLSDHFHVVYNVPTRTDGARVHKGLATSNLESCTPGASSIWCTLEPGKSTLPKHESNALFVAFGSGIGLTMAALEARASAKKRGEAVGRAVLIYGFRQTGKDQLFKDEIDKYAREGIIDAPRYVGSYDTPGKFQSPFDKIDQGIIDMVAASNGEIFYCGNGGSVPHLLETHFRRFGINVSDLRKQNRYHEEYFTVDLDAENLLSSVAKQQATGATLAERFANADMFCFQCEQTFRGSGCFKKGVCGKTPLVSALQDLIVYYCKVLGFYLHEARLLGVPENTAANRFSLHALFTTLTNVNFDASRHVADIRALHAAIQNAKATYEAAAAAAGKTPATLPSDAMKIPASLKANITAEELADSGRTVGVLTRFIDAGAQDSAAVCEMLVYGLKGIAAYADHACVNAFESVEIYAFMHKALNFLVSPQRHDVGAGVAMCLEAGKINVDTMKQLYESNSTLGVPSPQVVPVAPKPGKCILVSGHDLIYLRELLPLCDKANVNVYTHGEMLPAHGYPKLREHKSLAGHFGGAWYRQSVEFPHFPGPVLMTTNCLTEPHDSYRDRLFTAGAVGWPGVRHCGDNLSSMNFQQVVDAALAAPGFGANATAFTYSDPIGVSKRPATHAVGFGHETILSVAPQLIEAIKAGQVTRVYVIGGCDGYEGQRHAYVDLVNNLPPTSVILTLGCGKFRLLPLAEKLGTIGNTGIPRLLDVGQCNETYSAVVVALSLAKALNCEVKDLPLSIVLSWLEQKAAAVLLSCIHLGLKPIRIGPSLPAFVTPTVLKVLVENFGVLPLGDPAEEAKKMSSMKNMIE